MDKKVFITIAFVVATAFGYGLVLTTVARAADEKEIWTLQYKIDQYRINYSSCKLEEISLNNTQLQNIQPGIESCTGDHVVYQANGFIQNPTTDQDNQHNAIYEYECGVPPQIMSNTKLGETYKPLTGTGTTAYCGYGTVACGETFILNGTELASGGDYCASNEENCTPYKEPTWNQKYFWNGEPKEVHGCCTSIAKNIKKRNSLPGIGDIQDLLKKYRYLAPIGSLLDLVIPKISLNPFQKPNWEECCKAPKSCYKTKLTGFEYAIKVVGVIPTNTDEIDINVVRKALGKIADLFNGLDYQQCETKPKDNFGEILSLIGVPSKAQTGKSNEGMQTNLGLKSTKEPCSGSKSALVRTAEVDSSGSMELVPLAASSSGRICNFQIVMDGETTSSVVRTANNYLYIDNPNYDISFLSYIDSLYGYTTATKEMAKADIAPMIFTSTAHGWYWNGSSFVQIDNPLKTFATLQINEMLNSNFKVSECTIDDIGNEGTSAIFKKFLATAPKLARCTIPSYGDADNNQAYDYTDIACLVNKLDSTSGQACSADSGIFNFNNSEERSLDMDDLMHQIGLTAFPEKAGEYSISGNYLQDGRSVSNLVSCISGIDATTGKSLFSPEVPDVAYATVCGNGVLESGEDATSCPEDYEAEDKNYSAPEFDYTNAHRLWLTFDKPGKLVQMSKIPGFDKCASFQEANDMIGKACPIGKEIPAGTKCGIYLQAGSPGMDVTKDRCVIAVGYVTGADTRNFDYFEAFHYAAKLPINSISTIKGYIVELGSTIPRYSTDIPTYQLKLNPTDDLSLDDGKLRVSKDKTWLRSQGTQITLNAIGAEKAVGSDAAGGTVSEVISYSRTISWLGAETECPSVTQNCTVTDGAVSCSTLNATCSFVMAKDMEITPKLDVHSVVNKTVADSVKGSLNFSAPQSGVTGVPGKAITVTWTGTGFDSGTKGRLYLYGSSGIVSNPFQNYIDAGVSINYWNNLRLSGSSFSPVLSKALTAGKYKLVMKDITGATTYGTSAEFEVAIQNYTLKLNITNAATGFIIGSKDMAANPVEFNCGQVQSIATSEKTTVGQCSNSYPVNTIVTLVASKPSNLPDGVYKVGGTFGGWGDSCSSKSTWTASDGSAFESCLVKIDGDKTISLRFN